MNNFRVKWLQELNVTNRPGNIVYVKVFFEIADYYLVELKTFQLTIQAKFNNIQVTKLIIIVIISPDDVVNVTDGHFSC